MTRAPTARRVRNATLARWRRSEAASRQSAPNNEAAFQLRTTSGAPMALATLRREGGGDLEGGQEGGELVMLEPEGSRSEFCDARPIGQRSP